MVSEISHSPRQRKGPILCGMSLQPEAMLPESVSSSGHRGEQSIGHSNPIINLKNTVRYKFNDSAVGKANGRAYLCGQYYASRV